LGPKKHLATPTLVSGDDAAACRKAARPRELDRGGGPAPGTSGNPPGANFSNLFSAEFVLNIPGKILKKITLQGEKIVRPLIKKINLTVRLHFSRFFGPT
jgi:hypothetical protein